MSVTDESTPDDTPHVADAPPLPPIDVVLRTAREMAGKGRYGAAEYALRTLAGEGHAAAAEVLEKVLREREEKVVVERAGRPPLWSLTAGVFLLIAGALFACAGVPGNLVHEVGYDVLDLPGSISMGLLVPGLLTVLAGVLVTGYFVSGRMLAGIRIRRLMRPWRVRHRRCHACGLARGSWFGDCMFCGATRASSATPKVLSSRGLRYGMVIAAGVLVLALMFFRSPRRTVDPVANADAGPQFVGLTVEKSGAGSFASARVEYLEAVVQAGAVGNPQEKTRWFFGPTSSTPPYFRQPAKTEEQAEQATLIIDADVEPGLKLPFSGRTMFAVTFVPSSGGGWSVLDRDVTFKNDKKQGALKRGALLGAAKALMPDGVFGAAESGNGAKAIEDLKKRMDERLGPEGMSVAEAFATTFAGDGAGPRLTAKHPSFAAVVQRLGDRSPDFMLKLRRVGLGWIIMDSLVLVNGAWRPYDKPMVQAYLGPANDPSPDAMLASYAGWEVDEIPEELVGVYALFETRSQLTPRPVFNPKGGLKIESDGRVQEMYSLRDQDPLSEVMGNVIGNIVGVKRHGPVVYFFAVRSTSVPPSTAPRILAPKVDGCAIFTVTNESKDGSPLWKIVPSDGDRRFPNMGHFLGQIYYQKTDM